MSSPFWGPSCPKQLWNGESMLGVDLAGGVQSQAMHFFGGLGISGATPRDRSSYGALFRECCTVQSFCSWVGNAGPPFSSFLST